MKRTRLLIAVMALIVFAVSAQADTFYVKTDGDLALTIRDEYTNDPIGYIPPGEAVTPDPEKSTELAAYVTYNGVSGYVLWRYLSRTAPDQTAPDPEPTPAPDIVPVTQEVTLDDGEYKITVTGGVIHRANPRNHKAEGAEMTSVTVTAEDHVIISASVPKGQKIDYWVINGIRYDFDHQVKSFRLTHADRDWTFEIVYTKGKPETLLTADQILAGRTGDRLLVKAEHGELCHIKSGTKGAGGWITEFDFTNDYTNRATGAQEQGGQVTAKVRAVIPRGKTVSGWKFDETELYPNREVTWLLPHMLNTSMTYEPIFTGKATSKPDVTTPATQVQYYTVTCVRCTFSGGGYSNATSGTVPGGTKITVKANGGYGCEWYVNGSQVASGGQWGDSWPSSITRTINTNTRIEAYPVIN